MQDHGGDVNFETIAEPAGVTRGTLYRNLTDRQDLYEVVLEHELATMTRRSQHCPTTTGSVFYVCLQK